MDLQFKFKQDASASQRKAVVQKVEQAGEAIKAKPLFPDADDAELSTLYSVEGLERSPKQAELMDLLEADDAVEFASRPASRRPMS
jgi:hypothetical protein